MVLDAVAHRGGKQASMVCEDAPPHGGESLGDELSPTRWVYASYDQVPRPLACPESYTGNVQQGIENDAQQNCYRESTR
jgi:hypothetical protein